MRNHRLLVLVLVPAMWLTLTPVASARLVAKSALVNTATGATKIKVKLTSTTPVNADTKPRGVKMKAEGIVYPLALTTDTTRTNLGTWKSSGYTGATQEALLALAGETVKVIVRSRSGTTQLNSTLAAPPDGGGGGDVTGQEAIDQMTKMVNGGGFRFFSSGGDTSTEYELNLCTDGTVRYYQESNHIDFGPIATEKYGQPWAVTEGLIKPAEDYAGAIVEVTMTVQNNNDGTANQINEHFGTLLEYYQGGWYWEGNLTQTFAASCEPAF